MSNDNLKDLNQDSEGSAMDKLVADSFKKVFESINQFQIKEGVDTMGIDKFINHCALLAAGTGAVAGMGGAITMIIGVPADLLNNVLQQFRVTLGVIYDKTGEYKVSFPDFMKIVGVSLGVEVTATLTRGVLIRIAEAILARMTASAAGKAIPIFGAIIGGSVNYAFITWIGKAVQKLDI